MRILAVLTMMISLNVLASNLIFDRCYKNVDSFWYDDVNEKVVLVVKHKRECLEEILPLRQKYLDSGLLSFITSTESDYSLTVVYNKE